MIEVIIDRWSRSGKTDFLWSVWRDGQRIYQGDSHDNEDGARGAAIDFCRSELDHEPDRITQL